MNEQPESHRFVAWAEHRLEELDVLISQVESSIADLKEDARKGADAALVRLQKSRTKLSLYRDEARARVTSAKETLSDARETLEVEWIEVENAFQDFLSSARAQTATFNAAIAARVRARRQAWEATLADQRTKASAVLDKARDEFDAAIERVASETKQLQGRLGDVKHAGDASWTAVRDGLAEAKAVHGRTVQRIKDAFSSLA